MQQPVGLLFSCCAAKSMDSGLAVLLAADLASAAQTSYINRAPMNKRMITPTQPKPAAEQRGKQAASSSLAAVHMIGALRPWLSKPFAQTSYINRAPMNKRMITPTQPDPPEASCVVCGRAQMHLTINTQRPLADLVSQVSLLRPGCTRASTLRHNT